MKPDTNSKEKFLRLPEVKFRTGLSRSTIYALIGQSKFPRHIPLGMRCVGWLESEIDTWISQQQIPDSQVLNNSETYMNKKSVQFSIFHRIKNLVLLRPKEISDVLHTIEWAKASLTKDSSNLYLDIALDELTARTKATILAQKKGISELIASKEYIVTDLVFLNFVRISSQIIASGRYHSYRGRLTLQQAAAIEPDDDDLLADDDNDLINTTYRGPRPQGVE